MNFRDIWSLCVIAGRGWLHDNAPRLSAALAYYAVFSIAPLFVIVIAVVSVVFGRRAVEGHLIAELTRLVGSEGGAAIQEMIAKSSTQPMTRSLSTIASAIMLLFGAAGLFGQLQDALNTIWNVQPKSGRGVWTIVRERFLSFAMVLGCAFLLLVSLIISAALAAGGAVFGDWHVSILGQAVNFVVSFAVITALFAVIYRFLPDTKIAWKNVWLGALLTSLLFTIGKSLIGLYLGHSSVASAYGAAGSLAVLLIWLYYSSQIFLFGAELTKAMAERSASGLTAPVASLPGRFSQAHGWSRAPVALKSTTCMP